jgi:hypothetical protein
VSLSKTSLSKVCALSAFSVCASVIFGAGTLFRPVPQGIPHSAGTPIVVATPTAEAMSPVSVPDTAQALAEMTVAKPSPQVSVVDPAGLIADMMAVPQQIGMTANDADQVSAPAEPPQQQAMFVGVWAPDASSCSLQSFRDGLLPTVINLEGASAGDTFCSFKNQQQMQTGWRVDALCSNKRERWSARVHLSVNGDRLIWRSQRGSQSYARCTSDLRVAQAH